MKNDIGDEDGTNYPQCLRAEYNGVVVWAPCRLDYAPPLVFRFWHFCTPNIFAIIHEFSISSNRGAASTQNKRARPGFAAIGRG
jgi:hypothetical protein